MKITPPVAQIRALPIRHLLIAAAIAVAVTAAGLWGARQLPVNYSSSAYLSFDGYAASLANPEAAATGARPAEALARAILTDEALKALITQNHLFSRDPEALRAAAFRARLTLSQTSPLEMRVTWRDADSTQVVGVANSVTSLLASWVPAPRLSPPSAAIAPTPPARPTPHVSNPVRAESHEMQDDLYRLRARERALQNAQDQLQLQIDGTAQRLTLLDAEQRTLELDSQKTNGERLRQSTAVQAVEAQLTTAKKNLEALRARYTDVYPDVQAAQEHVAEVAKQLASMPRPRPVTDPSQARIDQITQQMNGLRMEKGRLLEQLHRGEKQQQSMREQEARLQRQPGAPTLSMHQADVDTKAARVSSSPVLNEPNPINFPETIRTSKSPFAILERAAYAQPVADMRGLLSVIAVLFGVACAIFYLRLSATSLRKVHGAAMLQQVLSGNVRFLGTVPRMNP